MSLLLLLYWGLISSTPSFATSSKVTACAETFASSSDSGIRDREVLQTYRALLQDLGGELTPALQKQIHDSGNPFILPENVGTSNSVRLGLSQLEEILRAHSEDITHYKNLILSELLKTANKQKTVEEKVESELKTKEAPFYQMRWGANMSNVLDLNGWYLGITSILNPKREFLFWQPNKELITRTLPGNGWPERAIYHAPTKTLYYSNQYSNKELRFRLPLLDSNNNPVIELVPEKISLAGLPSKHIFGMEISPDQQTVLFQQDRACYIGVFETGKLGGIRPVYTHKLSVSKGGFTAQFVGNSLVGIKTIDNIQFYDLSGKVQKNSIPIKEDLRNWSVSLDGKYLFLSYFPDGAVPYGERWDLEEVKKSKKAKPTTFSLGYLGNFSSGRSDAGDIESLVGTPFVIHFFYGLKNKGPFELRILDPSSSKILHKENLPIKDSLYYPQLSGDHTRIRAYKWNEDGTPTFIWNTEYLKATAELGS